MQDQSAIEDLKALERQRIAAMMAADVAALDDLLHPELVFGHTNGQVDTKEAYLGKFRAGAVRYFDADQHIEAAKVFGDAAFVTSHLRMRAELPAGSRQINVKEITVWTRDAGVWKMIAHHPTVIDT